MERREFLKWSGILVGQSILPHSVKAKGVDGFSPAETTDQSDDTAAIIKAEAEAFAAKSHLYFPAGSRFKIKGELTIRVPVVTQGATFDCVGNTNLNFRNNSSASALTVRNLHVRWQGHRGGLRIEDSSQVNISACNFTDMRGQAVVIRNSGQVMIDQSMIILAEGVTDNEGIVLEAVDNVIISNNQIRNFAKYGINVLSLKDKPSRKVKVFNNQLRTDLKIANNTLIAGIHLGTASKSALEYNKLIVPNVLSAQAIMCSVDGNQPDPACVRNNRIIAS